MSGRSLNARGVDWTLDTWQTRKALTAMSTAKLRRTLNNDDSRRCLAYAIIAKRRTSKR